MELRGRGRSGDEVEGLADDALHTPNCTACLTRMDAVDSPSGAPFWRCASCGRARLA